MKDHAILNGFLVFRDLVDADSRQVLGQSDHLRIDHLL